MDGVILGMPGPWSDGNHEVADHYTTKIGGVPDWPIPSLSIRPDLLECNKCGSKLCLIAQVYAPIIGKTLSIEERIIYVLGCLSPQCESIVWRALRVQKVNSPGGTVSSSNEEAHIPESLDSIANNYCQGSFSSLDPRLGLSDEDDEDDIDLEELGQALAEAANKMVSSEKKQIKDVEHSRKILFADQSNRPVYNKSLVMPCFYLYTQEEKLLRKGKSENSEHTVLSIKEYENKSEDDSSGETYEEESYEYDRALNADRTYLKFKKRMDVYPEQCFRYSYGGKPLMASGDAGDPRVCGLCGGPRHYEMQLMPPLIYFLQEAADDQQSRSLEKFNWMTLLVYTCSKSCVHPSYQGKFGNEDWMVAEEAVIIEHE